MAAWPNKCWFIALKTADGHRRYNPGVTISGGLLQYLDDGDFWYPGRPTNVCGAGFQSPENIQTKLQTFSKRILLCTLMTADFIDKLKQPVDIKGKFLTSSFHPTDD